MGGLNSGPGPGITLLIAIVVVLTQTALAAPVHEDEETQESNSHALAESHGCYYNFQHYNEGERILTNEPCLNCTCRNRMLMCYLRVCPFTKGIGQNCTVEKVPGQCCPIITCPEVPVQLLTSTTTEHSEGGKAPSHYYGNKGTAVGHLDSNGCNIDGIFYPNGAQVPGSPEKPCELCYCIRNKTACIMQECALHVDGCRPVYEEGQCFPVRYQCDDSPYEEEPTTTIRPAPTPGLIITTTSSEPLECSYNNDIYEDGSRIPTEDPCEHCYCLKGKIACAVQECGAPLEKDGQNCTALPPAPGKCCPDSYQCDNNVIVHAKENFIRMDRKQKFEPKPIEHNDITMTSQGLSSGSEGTTQSGIPSVADAGHPTDGYNPDKVTTEKPKFTTNRFDEESKVTEGVTPAKGIAEPSVTPEQQEELDIGTQKEKDSRPVKPVDDQKITFPDQRPPVKGEATVLPADHADSQVIHMSPEKQPHPDVESHKHGVTPQSATNDNVSESSAPGVKDPLIDKLHNIIQDVQSQVGDGKPSQMPEEVDMQTTTQSQKGHFTEKPDVLSHLPHSSTPSAEITNITKESSPEDTNILNQIQGIIQGIYSHVTDSIMSTNQPESTTEVGQLPGQQPELTEKEGVAGDSYPGQHSEGSKLPESPHGATGRPNRPIDTEHSPSTKYPQKFGSHEGSYVTQYPDEIGRPEGTTKYSEEAIGTQYPEGVSGRPKDPSKYSPEQYPTGFRPGDSKYPEGQSPQGFSTGEYPESVEVTGKPYDPSKYSETQKPDHHPSGVTEKPEDQTKYPSGTTQKYPEGSKYPQGYKPGHYPDGSKFPAGDSGKPEDHTKYPDGQYPDIIRPTGYYPESSVVTGKPYEPYDSSKYPSGQHPGMKPIGEHTEFTGVTGKPQDHGKYPEGVTGQYPTDSKYPGARPTGDYSEFGKPHGQSQYPEGAKPSEKYPGRPKPDEEYPESVTGSPENQPQHSQGGKPTGHYPTGSHYPEVEEMTAKPDKYPEEIKSTDKYPSQTSQPDEVISSDYVKPSNEYSPGQYPDGVTGKPEEYTKHPERVTGRPDETKYPHMPIGQHPVDSKLPERPQLSGQQPESKPGIIHPEATGKPHDDHKYPAVTEYPTKPKDSSYSTEYLDSNGKPKDPSKYAEGVQPAKENSEDFRPDGSSSTQKYPYYGKPTFGNEAYGTEYPESVTGKPVYPKYPTRPGFPSRPVEQPQGTEYPEEDKSTEEYPEGVTGKPEDHSQYPGQRPGVFRPTVVHPGEIKYPEGDTKKPEDSTLYPFAHGTEYPEGISGRPKDPSKLPEEVRPSDRYPSTTKYPEYPEGVTGKPEEHSQYPGQRPGVFRPTGEHPEGVRPTEHYPDGSKYPEVVTGRPEGTANYPEGEEPYGTEHTVVSGRPKDPSKFPVGEPTGATEKPEEGAKYPDGVRPGFKPSEKYPYKPEDNTEYPESGVTGKPQDEYSGIKPTGQYPVDSKYPEGVSSRPSGSTKHPEGFRPTGHYPGEVTGRPEYHTKYPEGLKPSGQISNDGESFNKRPNIVTKSPEEEATHPENTTDQYPLDSKYPAGTKPSEDSAYPDTQDHTKHPQKLDDNIYATQYPDVTGKPDSGYEGTSKYPSGSAHDINSQPIPTASEKPQGSNSIGSSYDHEYPEKVTGQPENEHSHEGDGKPHAPAEHSEKPTSTEYPKTAKPSRPHNRPGLQDEPFGTEYPETTEGEYESEYGTQYPESATKYPMLSKYPTKRPSEVDKHQQKPNAEDKTNTEHLEGSTARPESDGHPVVNKRPELKPEGKPESVTDIPEGIRPSSPAHYPSGPESIGQPHEKPEEENYETERPESNLNTERPHYTSKYPEKPSAEDQLLGTEQPHSKVTSHPHSADRPSENENKHPAEDVKHPAEGSTKSPYYTSKRPPRPGQDSKLPTEDTLYDTEHPVSSVTDKYPDESKRPSEAKPAVDEGSKYPGSEFEENKYPESVTGEPAAYPSKPEGQPHGTESLDHQTKYPESVKPDSKIPHIPESGTEYPQAGITEYPKGKPQHPTKYPEGSEPYDDKTGAQTPEDMIGHYPHETGKPLDQYPGAQYPQGSKQPDQSPTGTTNITSPDESTNILNQIHGIIQGIYSQVTDSIMSTIRPESATVIDGEGGKPQDSDHYSHSGQTEMEQPSGTELPSGVKGPEGVTRRPQIPGEYPEGDSKYPQGLAGHPDRFKPTGTPDASTKHPQNVGLDKETFPTEYPDATGQTGRPEGSNEFTNGDETYDTEHPQLSGKPKEPAKVSEDIKPEQQPEEFKPVQPHPIGTKYPEGTSGKPEDQTAYPEGITGHYPDDSKYPDSTGETYKPHGSKNPEVQPTGQYPAKVTERPEDQTKDSEEVKPTEKYPSGSKHPAGVKPSEQPGGQKHTVIKPAEENLGEITSKPIGQNKYTGGVKPTELYPEETSEPHHESKHPESQQPSDYKHPIKPEESPYDTAVPEKGPEVSTKYPEEAYGTEYPSLSSRPKDPSKYPEGQFPEEYKPGQQTHDTKPTFQVDSKYPSRVSEKPGVRPDGQAEETTGQPEYSTKYSEVDAEYSGVSSSSKDPSKYPETYKPHRPRPTESQETPYGTEYPDTTARPDGAGEIGVTSKYPQKQKPEVNEAYGTDYPEGSTLRPGLYPEVNKRPVSSPKPGAEYPEESTKQPERPGDELQSTDYPIKDEYFSSTATFGKPKPVTQDFIDVSGKPHGSIKHPTRPKPDYEEPHSTKHPEAIGSEYTEMPSTHEGEAEHDDKYPVSTDKHPYHGKPTFGNEAYGTEYPESVTGKPVYPKYPTRPGFPIRPVEQPQGTEYPEEDKSTEEYPEGVTGKPEDHSQYPGQRPGIFRPTVVHPGEIKYPEGDTKKPEDSTLYPFAHGTEYPEGISGRPKDPSKLPEEVRPSDRYPSTTKYPEYPEGVTGKPEEHSQYPGQRPGVFRPTGEHPEGVRPTEHYPDGSKYPEVVTGRPEGTANYPEGEEPYGTEHTVVSGRPKDPSKFPVGEPTGATEKPEEGAKYPDGVRPGFKPSEKYPYKPEDNTEYPESGVTGKPQDEYSGIKPTGQYPVDSKYPEGVSSRPSGSTKHPEGFRPTGHYPGEVTGGPEYHTKYPESVKPTDEYPDEFKPSPQHPIDSTQPSGVTGKPNDDFIPERVTLGPGSKYPDKVTSTPEDGTKHPEGGKPTGGYYEEHKPNENISSGVTVVPDDLTKYPDGVKPFDKDSSVLPPSTEIPDGFKPTGKYPEITTSAKKPESVKPTGQYPPDSKHPFESDYGTEYPESSTKNPQEFGTENPEGLSEKPKDPSKYPVQHPEGHKPTEPQYPETIFITGKPYDPSKRPEDQFPGKVKPEASEPTKQSSAGSKHPENATDKPEDQTKYPHIMTGRPEGPTYSLEGDSHVTEHPGVSGKPKDPSKQPEEIQSGQYPEKFKPSEQYPEGITGKPEEHTKFPDDTRPSGHYPNNYETDGVTGKPQYMTKHPGVRPTEQYEVGSKHPEGVKPSEQTSEDEVTEEKHSEGFKPTAEYPHGITGKPIDQTKYPEGIKPTEHYPVDSKYPENVKPSQHYPEGVTGRPAGTTYYPEEIYGTEHPGMSSKPKNPSVVSEGFKPEKYPDGSKPTVQHSGFVPTEQYPYDVTGKPEDHTKYFEVRPSGQHPEEFKPDEKHQQKPDDKFDTKYPQSITEQYPGSTGRPLYSTKYPVEGKPHDKEGITDKPVHPMEYPEDVRPTEQYPEEFKPTGQYPVDSEHATVITDKTIEDSKYPEGLKPSEQFPDGFKPTDSKYSGSGDLTKHPENIKPTSQYPDEPKYPGGVTERPQDYTKYPEKGTNDKPYDSNKHPQEVAGKPEGSTEYSEGMTEHYPAEIKPSAQYPQSSEVTAKPHDVSKYPEEQYHEDSKHPSTQYPEISKPSAEYPHEQKPSQKYPDSVTGKPESVTDYPEGDSQVTGAGGKPKDPTKYPEKVKPGQPLEELEPTGQYPVDTKHPEGITGGPEEHTEYPEGVRPIGHYPDGSKYPEMSGVTGKPLDENKFPEGATEEYPVDSKHPVESTYKPEDVSKYPEHPTKHRPTGITSKPEATKPGKLPHETETVYETGFSQSGATDRPEHQTEYPEGFTDEYPGVSGRPQYVTKYPEVDSGATYAPEEHHPMSSKRPSRPDDHIIFPEQKPTVSSEDSKPFEKQPELGTNEQYPDGVTYKPHDYTKYPGETSRPEYITKYPDVRPGGHEPEDSKYPTRPESASGSTEYQEITGKYPEISGTEYPDSIKPTGQVGSKYPEKTTEKHPGLKPSSGTDHTTILPMDFEESDIGVADLIEYQKKPKPQIPSEENAATTIWPVHKYPVKHPQKPDGLGDESIGTEYPETTEPDYEFDTGRPNVIGESSSDKKPGESKPTKPGTQYLPQGSEKPSLQTHGLDENFLPFKETQTTPITDSELGKPTDGSKPSSVGDSSRPRPTVPGEGLYNENLTEKPLEQSTSGTGVHPSIELTPDTKIPEGALVTGQPEKYPSTEKPLENLSTKPTDESAGEQLGTNRHPETTPDDDLINKLHNIISGIQSQTNIPSEQSSFSPLEVDKFGRPIPTHVTEIYTTTKGSYVTDRPQERPGSSPVEEATQHSGSSKPLSGHPAQSLSTENPKLSTAEYFVTTESDKTAPHLPTDSAFHTVTPQDGIQKQTSTGKPLHVVYPTYYPDGVVTRKPGAKPDDGDKKVTVTPQSTHEKAPEHGETPTVYDVQTEISSEIATTPGVVIVEEVHTEIHSERPTKRPIFGPAVTQPGSSHLSTHSGYQTEVPETTKPFYVTVTPAGTVSESDHFTSPKEKQPATDIPATQSFITEPAVQQHTRFPSRKTTQTPIDELTTHKPQGASYVPYKLVNSTKVYYPEKELPQKPLEFGPYDGYDPIPYEVVNGTKFFYPNRVATEQPTTSATFGMYVPYKIINGTKIYYTQDPPQEPEKYDGLDYVPFEIINGTKVFYPERVPTTPSPTTAMYVPFKIVNGNKVYYPKDAKDEPQDIPDEYDGFDYVPFETVNGKKVFHPERTPNHTPAGSDYVPYKLMNNNKIYYPKDAQNVQEKIPEGYDGLDSVPYDIIDNEKVYYPDKAIPQKPSAMFVPYKLVNGTKVYYPKQEQDKPSEPPEGYDGFDYIPYDTVNGTKVFHPERITSKPAYYPNKMFVPFKIVNNTKVFYPKDAQNKPRPLKPEYDGVEYLPYDVVNGTKVFHPPAAPTSAMYVPYVIKNGEKVYDLKKATDDPKEVPEGYDGVDYLPYEVKDGSMIFYPEKTVAPKQDAMYVPYKLINGTKIYYADKATDKPEYVPKEYDGFDYLPYEVQNGNKIFYPDRVAPSTTPAAPRPALYVPYKLVNGKKVYETDKATENPQDIPEEFDGFDYVPYDIKNGNKVFYPESVALVPREGAMYVPYKLNNGTKVYYADKAADKPEDVPKDYDGFDYIPYELQNGNKIFYPDKVATATTPPAPRPALYVPYKLVNGKKVYETDKATENPQDIPEEFDGFDYVPYDIKNGNKVFYPERVKPSPKQGVMYVPYKLNNGTKVYYANQATEKPEDISKDYDGFDYIPYEIQNGNKLFYPDRIATPTTKKAMYVPYKLENGKKIYQTDKATHNPQGIQENFDGFDYVPYVIENGKKVFHPEKVLPTKGSEYVPYKIVNGMKVYHPEKAADKTQEIPEEFDGFDFLPFETQNGNKIFYPDRVTQAPKGAVYVPYKLVNGKKVYNPNKATNNPQDVPIGYDGCDYIPYEIKDGNKVFHPEQVTPPAPTQGSMYVPYKLINGTKVYYADKATDKKGDVPEGFDGFDYLPYELQNGNKIFYPDRAHTPAPNKLFKYIPYKLVNGRKVYYPDRAADKPEDVPKGFDGFDYLPIEYTNKPQDLQGMFVPYKTINGTKVYYPQEAHKRPHPLSDEYSGLDYMPYETINGTKVFYPEREPQAMYVPYKIINDSKVFYPKDAKRTPEEIPAGYDGLDYVPYDIVNGSQIYHPDRVPEYQGMFVPYKTVNGKKVFYPKYAQHKPMVMDGYDGFDYLPYENVNGTKVFKPEVPEQAMYVPYKIMNGTKVYYPKFAQRKPGVPVGYDGSDYIPYQIVNGTKIFDPSIKPAMFVPYKIMDGTKVYYPKHAQHNPEHIPSGYDGHDYLPYEVINGNKVFKPGQATSQEQVMPQIKQSMYVPYKIINGTKVYHTKHAQNKPEYIPDGYDGHDYLPYEIVNGNKVFKPEQITPQIKPAMYVPYKIVNGTKVYHPKHAQHNPYLIPAGYDGFDYIPYEIVNGTKVFHPEQSTTAPPPPKQAMYVPYKLVNGTKAYYPKYAQRTPAPVPSNYDGLDYLPFEVVNGTKVFEPQPHTKPTYLQGMFVPYKLSNNTKIFYPKDAHNKPHYVPQGYDGADYVPYEVVNSTKLFYPELISMAQPSTANIPGIYVPFRLVNSKKVFYPKEATPFPPTVQYPYDGVAFVPYKSSVPSEIIYVDEADLTKPHILSGHVPGEGNCYLNNKTYTNNSEVAPVSPCQAKCTCISSVVRCVRVKCPTPPQNKLDCSPVYREGTCCPTYSCGEAEYEYPTTVGYPETKAPEGTSHEHNSESTTAFTDLTSQKKKPEFGEEGKPGQQSEEYHLHKPPKPSEHESLEPYDVEGHLSPEEDYDVEDEEPYGPGTCRYAGKVYVSAQQIPRDDPCDFCFCFRSDIICLQQSCPPPIPGCRDEPIEGFCCPRYECHVKMATLLNVTSTTTTTTTTVPPHFFPHAYKGSATRTGCFVQGKAYRVGQPIPSASGPCMDCICGGNGRMKCEPKVCTPEPMIRKMISPSESTTTSTNER